MNTNWFIKKLIVTFAIWTILCSINFRSSHFTGSCNYYLSSRNCRSEMIEIMKFVKKIQQIDTLFVIYPKGDYAEKENLLRIFNRHWNQTIIRDTVFGEFEGDIFDMNAKTTFNDSALNSLFKKSTPLLFNRDHYQIRIIAN